MVSTGLSLEQFVSAAGLVSTRFKWCIFCDY